MAFNSHTAGPDTGHAATALTSLSKMAHGFVSILVRFMAKAHSAMRTLQMARMLSTLSNMSDHQLAQIGIQRSDIPKYAETLMAEE
ncbi:DUF1127 domain-containing protein [Sulfitobacter sp. SK011]|jgi:uncharacterized protein YjiS (DUF1127 family)|uniref:DUF1127 domain-containing protein n=1 Tax=Sulfitobacter sp. SK011 TaxID=1389004 RepID=UPI0020C75A61|nr:DUF1127 domain-containing protein [Sulfitobacter sp. SK011]